MLGLVVAIAIGLLGRQAPDVDRRVEEAQFVRADGRRLMRQGAPFRFRAVNFSNGYSAALGAYGFTLNEDPHHGEEDIANAAALGFNALRFGFNASWWRDDPWAFWRWLDRNITWARRHDMLLSLDLHVPLGGDWLDGSKGPGEFAIWTDPAVAEQTIELWRQIATRYRDEPVIAAYDILNEPVTVDATGDQWRRLAADITAAIRRVDTNHLIIVGPVYGTEGGYAPLSPEGQFLVEDGNVLYDLHFYEPIPFTHQTAGWLGAPIVDGGRYPDPDRLIPSGHEVLIDQIEIATPPLEAGDTGWRQYESGWVEVRDARAVAALPIAVMRGEASGTARFDEIAVFERSASGEVVRRLSAPLTEETVGGWWPWSTAGEQSADFTRLPSALAFAAQTQRGEDLGWSNDDHWIALTPGHAYKITGQMQGAGVDYGPSGGIGLALDVYADPETGPTPGFHTRDRAYLAHRLDGLLRFGETHNVPMSVMEFGTIQATIDDPAKGGALWVADMLDLFDERGLSYALWTYRGPSMGLYLGEIGEGPPRPNLPLLEVIRAHHRPEG